MLRGALFVCAALFPACATRTIAIESDPPGAEVVVFGETVGTTPMSLPFLHGGPREFVFLLPGYEPLVVSHDSDSTVFDTPFVDGAAALIGQGDAQVLSVQLQKSDLVPQLIDDEEAVLDALERRANRLADHARELELSAPPPPSGPIGPTNRVGGRVLRRR